VSRNFPALALKYARRAAADTQQVEHCQWVRLAAARHLADLEASKDPRYPYEWSRDHVNHVCAFVELLPHVEGTWASPTIVLEPPQIFWLACIFGWRRRADGYRRFDTAYIEVPRKNAKSAIAAAIGLYCLTADGEVGPQVKCAATTGDQARIVFDVARKMADKTPALREHYQLDVFVNAIASYATGGNMKPINAKASTQDGLNPSLAINDELHAHKKRDLYDVLRSARGARKQPLTLNITTAGYNILGVCFAERKTLTKILQGHIDLPHVWGIIYTIDRKGDYPHDPEKADDPYDPRMWAKANPMWACSINQREFRDYASEAKHDAEKEAELLTKRLNVWTTAKNAWLPAALWARNGGKVDLAWLKPYPCYGGLDLASTEDMCAFALVWRVDGVWYVWVRYYLPEETVQPRTERGNVPYQQWADQGIITITPGSATDYAYIEKDVREAFDVYNLKELAYDRWNATDLANRLTETSIPIVPMIQGPISYHPAMSELHRALLGGKVRHGNNPVLNWNMSNLVARKDPNNNMAPDRKNSHEKIDGAAATLMGIARALANGIAKPEPKILLL